METIRFVPDDPEMLRAVWDVTPLRMAIRKESWIPKGTLAAYWVVKDIILPPTRCSQWNNFFVPVEYREGTGNRAYPICGRGRTGITIGSLWIRDFLENNPEIKSKVVKYFLMRR